MNIIINGFQIDKTYILDALAKNSKLIAIKFVKDNSDLNLQDSKTVVDNLVTDPNYYDGKEHHIESIPDTPWVAPKKVEKSIGSTSKPTPNRRKNRYEKNDNQLSYNLYIALFILVIIACSVYFYLYK